MEKDLTQPSSSSPVHPNNANNFWQLFFFIFYFFKCWNTTQCLLHLQSLWSGTKTNKKKSSWIHYLGLSKLFVYSSHCLPRIQMRSGITRNCVAFLFAYQKEEVLEQHVHTWRADNPAICYFTRHLQVSHSSHTTHSGQYRESSTLHCSEHHVPRLLWRKILHWFLLCYSDIPLPILTLNWIHIFLPPIYRFILNASFRNLYAVQF